MENLLYVTDCILASSNKGHKKAQRTWEWQKGLTWYFHPEEGKDFNYKYRNPADGIREHYKKETVCDGRLSSSVIPHFWSLQGSFLNGTEHNSIGKHNDEKSQQIHTCWEKHTS